ncbi:MAG: hypothetical protein M1296_01820 [Chloroflexi bacterium]|nr:hypothetical protein [Chloroflexota bacterium]
MSNVLVLTGTRKNVEMGTIRPQASSDRLLEQLTKAVLATDIQGMLVCPLPGCNVAVGYAVDDLVNHLWTHHRKLVIGVAAALTLWLLSTRRRSA